MTVPAQRHIKELLCQIALGNRVPHALLLNGPTGNGGLALAVWMAQLLQCQHPTATGPCEACPACRKSSQFIHPDIHFSFPTIGEKKVSNEFLSEWRAALSETPFMDVNTWLARIGAENKQGNINKDECNAIIKKLSLKVFEGKFKILLMWLPEYLGREGNRLLKLIEEPPDQTVFLLVSENTDLILPTILSRCQLVKVPAYADDDLAEAIRERMPEASARAEQLAFLADGNLHLALQLAQNKTNDDATQFLEWLRRCWKGNGVELVQWSEKMAAAGRENQKQFLLYSLHFLREVNQLLATGNARLRLGDEETASALNMAKVLNLHKTAALGRQLNDSIYHIERNANPKIVFLDLSIRINRIMKEPAREVTA